MRTSAGRGRVWARFLALLNAAIAAGWLHVLLAPCATLAARGVEGGCDAAASAASRPCWSSKQWASASPLHVWHMIARPPVAVPVVLGDEALQLHTRRSRLHYCVQVAVCTLACMCRLQGGCIGRAAPAGGGAYHPCCCAANSIGPTETPRALSKHMHPSKPTLRAGHVRVRLVGAQIHACTRQIARASKCALTTTDATCT
jgi:hypothetical protein